MLIIFNDDLVGVLVIYTSRYSDVIHPMTLIKVDFCLIASKGIRQNQLHKISHICQREFMQSLIKCLRYVEGIFRWKVKIVDPQISDQKDCSDWFADDIKVTSRASSSPAFRQRFLSGDSVKIRCPYIPRLID